MFDCHEFHEWTRRHREFSENLRDLWQMHSDNPDSLLVWR